MELGGRARVVVNVPPVRLGVLLELRRSRRDRRAGATLRGRGLRVGLGAWSTTTRARWCWRPLRCRPIDRARHRDRLGLRPLAAADGGYSLDLDEMSDGRFSLGLGTGTRRMRTDWLGAPAERPARRLRETVEAVRAVWAAQSAGSIQYEGELVRLSVRPYARANQVREQIPVHLAAINDGMSRTAGAIADGVIAHPMATGRYIAEVMRPAIAEGAEAEGRSGDEVEVSDWVVVAVSDDEQQAREDVKRQIAFHATVRTYDRILELHGFEL